MREIRTYGSEGGGTGTTGSPYPYPAKKRQDPLAKPIPIP